MPRLSAVLILTSVLGACSDAPFDQPLSTLAIRDALVERPILVSVNGWNASNLFLRHNSVAVANGPAPEFGKWRIDGAGALCLQWRDQPEHCAFVYATAGSHYRFGDSELSVLGR